MKFLTRLWTPKTKDIILRLVTIGEELAVAQQGIDKLAGTTNAYIQEDEEDHRARILHSAIEDYGIAMWVKDLDSRFIYANKVCCSMILKCTLEEALAFRDDDFAENALANVCLKSDHLVIEKATTIRYIEHGIYNGTHVVLDTIKSPFYGEDRKIVGTLGSCHDITPDIPEHVIQSLGPCSAEVPIKAILGKKELIKYLEDCK